MNHEPTINRNWSLREIGSFCRVSGGGTPSRFHQEYFKGDIPWVKISDMEQWRITDTEEKITKEALENSSAKVFPKGTVLVSIFATIGSVSILEIDAATNQAIAGVIPDSKIALPDFVAYYLNYLKPKLSAMSRGVAQQNLNQTILKSIEIPVPSLEDQLAITSRLEFARELTRKRQKANQLSSKLVQSVFLKMFGDPTNNPRNWVAKQLRQIIIDKPAHGKSLVRSKVTEELTGIPVLRLGALGEHGFDATKIKYYDDIESSIAPWILQRDDILISRSNTIDLVGRVGRYEEEPARCIFPDLMIRIRANSNLVSPIYLEHYLRTQFVKRFFQNRARGTAAHMPKISNKDIEDVAVLLPPIELQRKFVSLVKAISSLRAMQEVSSRNIEQLLIALVHKEFG